MNQKESAQLLNLMLSNYPDTRKQMSNEVLAATVKLWAMSFANESYKEMCAVALAYMSSDTNPFMPNVGQMRAKLEELKNPDADDTGMEAWNNIKKACANSLYHSKEEFEKLGELEREIVQSPTMLKEWARLDSETFNSITMSHVLKAARVEIQRQKTNARLPQGLKELFSPKEIPEQPDNRQLLEDYEVGGNKHD